MKETDLFLPVKELFCDMGYKVDGEVKDCDMTCLLDVEGDTYITVVELKRCLSVELLAQAHERQARASFVFVAVPQPKNFTSKGKWKNIISLLKRLGVGLIFVDLQKNMASVIVESNNKIDRRKNNKKKAALIKEASSRMSDYNIGGNCRNQIVTYYKEQCIFVAYCLKKYGVLTTNQLKELGVDSKKATSICYNNFYDWYIKVDRATYDISDKGLIEIENYKRLTKKFDEMITPIAREKYDEIERK